MKRNGRTQKKIKNKENFKSKRALKRVIIFAVCFALLLSLSLVFIYSFISYSTKGRIYDTDYKESGYDCILILGAKVYNNKPSEMLQDRLDAGAMLYYNGVATTGRMNTMR